jgi:hypothetical protein
VLLRTIAPLFLIILLTPTCGIQIVKLGKQCLLVVAQFLALSSRNRPKTAFYLPKQPLIGVYCQLKRNNLLRTGVKNIGAKLVRICETLALFSDKTHFLFDKKLKTNIIYL